MTNPPEAQAVLDFWFGASSDPERDRRRKFWFVKSAATDRAMAERFGPWVGSALAGGLDGWIDASPSAALARVLLLDQFTRNIHRDTPDAFAGDAQALAGAVRLVEAGDHLRLPPVRRAFVYLPFEHAENLADQDRAVTLYTALVAVAPELCDMLDHAERHRAVIRRFGRFPHRNAVLGRESTAEEVGFLHQPGSRF